MTKTEIQTYHYIHFICQFHLLSILILISISISISFVVNFIYVGNRINRMFDEIKKHFHPSLCKLIVVNSIPHDESNININDIWSMGIDPNFPIPSDVMAAHATFIDVKLNSGIYYFSFTNGSKN